MQRKSLEPIRLGKRLLMTSLTWHRYVMARLASSSTSSLKNHYEVLELERECSPHAIKDSFIRLSKEVHPDKNPDTPDVHLKFILLNEAYSVLSKPHERRMYDAELVYRENSRMHSYNGVVTNAPRDRVIFKDDTLWENRDRSEDHKYEGRPYYGFPGIKNKLPNHYIAFGAIIFMLVGGIFHFFVATTSSAFTIEQLDKRDRLASLNHKMAKQQALANGNELQMTLLRQKSEENKQGD